jgi:hypothetical protein
MILSLGAVRRLDRVKFHRVALREYGRSVLRARTLLFILFVFVLAMHWGIEGTVYSPFLRNAFGLSDIGLALYLSAGLFCLSFSAVLVGAIRFNLRANKSMVLAAMAVSGIGFIMMAAVRGTGLSFAFSLLHQFGDGVLGALLTLFTSRLFEKRIIGGGAGFVQAVPVLGLMVGAMIFSPLGYRLGLQIPFFVCGGLLILNAIYGAVIFRRIEY